MATKRYTTIPELAKMLGVSRVTVYNWVKKGDILATKVGKTYIITDKTVNDILSKRMTEETKRRIRTAVKRTVREHGEILERLSRE